jgi:hypothetical protein
VFTARYALSPYIKQIRFVFKRLMLSSHPLLRSPTRFIPSRFSNRTRTFYYMNSQVIIILFTLKLNFQRKYVFILAFRGWVERGLKSRTGQCVIFACNFVVLLCCVTWYQGHITRQNLTFETQLDKATYQEDYAKTRCYYVLYTRRDVLVCQSQGNAVNCRFTIL